MLSWARNDWPMKMRETSRGLDKKLGGKNNLAEGGSLRGQAADFTVVI